MKEIMIDSKYHEKKLSSVLKQEFSSMKSSTLYKALRKKDILVNQTRIKEDCIVKAKDHVLLYIPDEALFPIDYEIVYQDEDLLVVNKPAGTQVTGENGLSSFIKQKEGFPFLEPCHRLDVNTTGLLLFAKNQEALDILTQKFKNREIEKHYLCVVSRNSSKKGSYFASLSL